MNHIDAHVHVWTDDYERFPFAEGHTPEGIAPRAFHPEEILAHAKACGVDRVVLVQMIYYGTDNSYMLHVMDDHPGVFGGIAVVDPHGSAPDQEMLNLAEQGVRGFRVYAFPVPGSGAPAESWLDGVGYERMFRAGAEANLAICALMSPDGLPALDRQCERFPQTPVIIDHLCSIGAGDAEIRQEDVSALCAMAARHPKVMVKLSAFYALGEGTPPYADLAEMIEQVYEAFGAARLMWASDCPYQVQGDHRYEPSIALIRDGLDFLSDADRQQILRGTAAGVFFG